jgi:hypothetical protein
VHLKSAVKQLSSNSGNQLSDRRSDAANRGERSRQDSNNYGSPPTSIIYFIPCHRSWAVLSSLKLSWARLSSTVLGCARLGLAGLGLLPNLAALPGFASPRLTSPGVASPGFASLRLASDRLPVAPAPRSPPRCSLGVPRVMRSPRRAAPNAPSWSPLCLSRQSSVSVQNTATTASEAPRQVQEPRSWAKTPEKLSSRREFEHSRNSKN